MLARIDRVKGFRMRSVLRGTEQEGAADLAEHFRSRRPPAYNEECARLRKRHSEKVREADAAREAVEAARRDDADNSELRELSARQERADAAAGAARHELSDAKHAWDTKRPDIVKQALYDAHPTLQKAFACMAGVIEDERALTLLRDLGGALELDDLQTEDDPDASVALALFVVVGQGLDEYWRQSKEVGGKLGRELRAAPSELLGRVLRGAG